MIVLPKGDHLNTYLCLLALVGTSSIIVQVGRQDVRWCMLDVADMCDIVVYDVVGCGGVES